MTKITQGTVVRLTYELRENNAQGPLLERMDNYQPFEFLYGYKALLLKFEAELEGLTSGDTFSCTLSPEDAYGYPSPENIRTFSREIFERSSNMSLDTLHANDSVSLVDDGGVTHHGKIISKTDEEIPIDFNFIMAGKTLHFEGEILHVRPASAEERQRKHHYGSDGIHHNH